MIEIYVCIYTYLGAHAGLGDASPSQNLHSIVCDLRHTHARLVMPRPPNICTVSSAVCNSQ